MNNNKLTVLVGIPAYNEEANIGHLLRSVLSQKEENFVLKEVFVVTDDSTDRTNERVKEITDKRIRLITDRERKGQVHAQNRIFAEADTDIVVLFEADTLPSDREHIAKLIEPILADPAVGLVQGNIRPVESESFLGKTMKAQQEIYLKFAFNREFANWFSTGHGGRAFTKKVYGKLVWPSSVPEDVYALLWCRNENIKTLFQKSTYCLYRPPENLNDLLKARQKIKSGKKELEGHFPERLVGSFYNLSFGRLIGFRLKAKMLLQFLTSNPLLFLYYAYLKIKIWLLLKDSQFTDFWDVGSTTKNLKIKIHE